MTTILRGALAALLLLLAVGCSDADSSDTTAEDPTEKVEVEVGEEFTWNDFTVADGWELTQRTETISMEEVDLTGIAGEVTNDAGEARFAVFEFIFVTDDKLQATIRCTSDEVPAGESRPMECPGFGGAVPPDYDLIQVQQITR